MNSLIIITIIIISIAQSIFGVGVLLFGTPLLLLYGYDFVPALYLLLPISIFISLLQTFSFINKIKFDFFLKFLFFSVPFVIVFLFLGIANNFEFGLFVGILLIIISLKKRLSLFRFFFDFIGKFERTNFMIMGILHGLTNLGGSLLTAMVFNKDLSKNETRSTIAICYAAFAFFQLFTIVFLFKDQAQNYELDYSFILIGVLAFIFCEKLIFIKINKQKYENLFSFFLFVSGASLIIKQIGLY